MIKSNDLSVSHTISAATAVLIVLSKTALCSAAQTNTRDNDLEKCFGVAKAGGNDSIAAGSVALLPDSVGVNFDGVGWKFVVVGT